jgi:hypothetical protein
MDIDLFNTNLLDEIKRFLLSIRTKVLVEFGHLGKILWGYIWVKGRFSDTFHKRRVEQKANNRIISILDNGKGCY